MRSAHFGRRFLQRLVRTAMGPVTLAGLAPSAWRPLSDEEAAGLGGATAPGPRPRPSPRDPLQVAIDGTSGAGKSTVGRALADRIGARFVDTGLLYRTVALAAIESGTDPEDATRVARLATQAAITVEDERVRLDGRDVTDRLRSPRIERAVPM
jgi:hypothetical protein